MDNTDQQQEQQNFVQVLDENGNSPVQPESELTVASSYENSEEIKPIDNNKPIKKQLTDQEQYDQWLADPKNKENALSLANQILLIVGKNWITISRLAGKAKITHQDAMMKLQMCKLFGYAEVKIGNFRDGTKDVRKPMFKITITNQDRIEAIDQVIQYHKDQIEAFEIQKKQYLLAQ